jgi:hypothetical protein
MSNKLTIENPLGWRSRALLAESEEERLRTEIERLRAFLTEIEAGFSFHRWSAAEMASEARAALDGAREPRR